MATEYTRGCIQPERSSIKGRSAFSSMTYHITCLVSSRTGGGHAARRCQKQTSRAPGVGVGVGISLTAVASAQTQPWCTRGDSLRLCAHVAPVGSV